MLLTTPLVAYVARPDGARISPTDSAAVDFVCNCGTNSLINFLTSSVVGNPVDDSNPRVNSSSLLFPSGVVAA